MRMTAKARSASAPADDAEKARRFHRGRSRLQLALGIDLARQRRGRERRGVLQQHYGHLAVGFHGLAVGVVLRPLMLLVHVPDAFDARQHEAVEHGTGCLEDADHRVRRFLVLVAFAADAVRPDKLAADADPVRAATSAPSTASIGFSQSRPDAMAAAA